MSDSQLVTARLTRLRSRFGDRTKEFRRAHIEELFAEISDLHARIEQLELPVRDAMKLAGGDGIDSIAYCRMMQKRLEGMTQDRDRLARRVAELENAQVARDNFAAWAVSRPAIETDESLKRQKAHPKGVPIPGELRETLAPLIWKCTICSNQNPDDATHCRQCEYSRMVMRDGKRVPREGNL